MNPCVHSISRVVFSVPDLAPAEQFYSAFGLDLRRNGDRLDLHTHGHAHRWVSIVDSRLRGNDVVGGGGSG